MTKVKIYKIIKHGKEELRIDNNGGDFLIPDKDWAIIEHVDTMLSPPEKRILWHLAKTSSGHIANLGHARGGSAIVMGLALKHSIEDRYRLGSQVSSIDLFKDSKFDECKFRLDGYNLNNVFLHRGYTHEIGEQWLQFGHGSPRFNLVFIDAGHDYENVKRDWLIFKELVYGTNPIIAFHDTNQIYTNDVIEQYVLTDKHWKLVHHVDRIKAFQFVG